MTFAEYRRTSGINWSTLKAMDESPLHYLDALTRERHDTASLSLGRYVHTAVLQPERLAEDYAIWEHGDRRGKAWTEFAAEHADSTIFKRAEVEAMDPIIDRLRTLTAPFMHPLAFIEHALTWTDPATDQRCKCRLDLATEPDRTVIDLKTARSIDLRRLGHDIARYGYLSQLAHYSAGITHALGWTPTRHLLIVVENVAPFDGGVFELSEDALNVGAEKVAQLLQRVAECKASSQWPGRYPDPVTLDGSNLPPWIFGGGIPEFAFVEDGT